MLSNSIQILLLGCIAAAVSAQGEMPHLPEAAVSPLTEDATPTAPSGTYVDEAQAIANNAEAQSILRTDMPIPLTDDSFVKFASLFNKVYPTAVEAAKRKQHFLETASLINQQNAQYAAGNSTWYAGLNEYHDLSQMEFSQRLTGSEMPNSKWVTNTAEVPDDNITEVMGVDWTSRLSGIQKQGCGDCWAFGSGAALEFRCGAGKVNEAEIRDCSGKGSCKGGNPVAALQWACRSGVEARSVYPVPDTSRTDQQCRFKGKGPCRCSKVNTGKGAGTLKSWVSRGVVAVAIRASSKNFQIYRGGVFTDDCGGPVDHSVSIVGFDGKNYKLRNQWGKSWGKGGYMTIPSGTNQCNVEGQLAMPQ